MKTLNALRALADLALAAPDVEPLVVCDAVSILARLTNQEITPEEYASLHEMGKAAALTALAIRDADEKQLMFRELLNSEGGKSR